MGLTISKVSFTLQHPPQTTFTHSFFLTKRSKHASLLHFPSSSEQKKETNQPTQFSFFYLLPIFFSLVAIGG
jgi:hypothetical protein